VTDLSGLAGRVFVSHSYRDTRAVCDVCTLLPDPAEPVIAAPVDAENELALEKHLAGLILSADALVYVADGESATSRWVAFERACAVLAGKPVFGYRCDAAGRPHILREDTKATITAA
jgi:hypothetical protein